MDSEVRQHGSEVLYLLPREVRVDERFNLRKWANEAAEEQDAKLVEELAASIERDGQLDAGIVFPSLTLAENREEVYTLYAGHRRLRALNIFNEKLTAQGKPLERFRVVVDRTGGDMLQKALVTNLQRKNHTPMELALIIKRIREEKGWAGFKGAKKVAEYLRVNVATVTQHERFLTADPLIQEKLHAGVISAQSAFELLTVKPEKQAKVLEAAAEIQEAEAIDSAVDAVEAGESTPEEGAAKIKKAKGGRIEHPAIRKAIRKTEGATDEKLPPTRKEIVEWFDQQDGPANGYPDGAVRSFARYFVDKFCKGAGSERTLQEKFDKMTDKAPKGTASSQPKEDDEDKSKKKKAKKQPKSE